MLLSLYRTGRTLIARCAQCCPPLTFASKICALALLYGGALISLRVGYYLHAEFVPRVSPLLRA